jgi:hypothetical protein
MSIFSRFRALSGGRRALVATLGSLAAVGTAASIYFKQDLANRRSLFSQEKQEKITKDVSSIENSAIPSRAEQLESLQSKDFDVLIIGGG